MRGSERWPNLFSGLKLGSVELPNRIVMPAMDVSLGDADGHPTPAMVRHYRDRAAGGVGLIVTGNIAVQSVGRLSPWMCLLSSDAHIEPFARVIRAVHEERGRIFLQLSHAGRQTVTQFAGAQPVSASAIACPVMRDPPRALLDHEVDDVADAFVDATVRAAEAGADGVEYHMAHGYLVCQFLSPYSNHREDRWGLNLEGRSRLAVEIVRRARSRMGPSFPLQVRLSADERVEGGITPPLALEIALCLAAAGATSFSVSACNYESYRFNMPAYYLPEATYTSLAAELRSGLRQAGFQTPVIAVGRFRRPEIAEAILARGDADLVAMGRALIADPDLPKHLLSGRPEAVRPCVACNRCAEAVTKGPVKCLINPEAGLDAPAALPVESARRILVVGGGPAGVTLAVEASRRGHHVRLVEREERLGGKAWASAAPPLKEAFGEYAAHLERMAHEAGVQVEHGVEFGVAEVRNATEEVIYLCTGGRGREPPEALNLASHPRVLRPQEALAEVHGEVDVLVLGGGPEGCEVADALAARGSKVRIVELRPKVGLGLPSSVRYLLVDRLKEAGVTVHVSRTLAPLPSAGEEVTLLDRKQNSADRVPYPDIIVLAIGVEREEHFDALEDDARVHRLGDARQPATILEAVAEGWRAGREVR